MNPRDPIQSILAPFERGIRTLLNELDRSIRKLKMKRLQYVPRYTQCETTLLDQPTRMVDSASFLSAYRAIFEDEIYAFSTMNKSPTIIDGGANIGLATLYRKKRWPEADITAFEPDPQVFEVLKWNCEQHGYSDVNLVQKGLWSENGTLQFDPDGADAGQLQENPAESERGQKGTVAVPVIRLAHLLPMCEEIPKPTQPPERSS